MIRPAILIILATLTACTWVKLENSGARVRVADASESLSGCEYRGELTVMVTHRFGQIERNALKVADELETLARNEAAGMQANTIKPLSQPAGGEQRFGAYDCR
jgi:hypothetical protein